MSRDASELARRLARDAEAVCRHYLSNGRRRGRYWTVGDVRNTPGRSRFVRLSGPESGRGAAGHWTDAASAEYGDLLDVIRESCGLVDFSRCRRGGTTLSESAAGRTGVSAEAVTATCADRLAGGRTTALCHVSASDANTRRDVSP